MDDTDIRLPAVPDAEQPAAYAAVPDIDNVFPDIATFALGPDEPALDALVWSPLTLPWSIAGYAIEGEESLAQLESWIADRASELDSGKISKYDAYYLPQTPFPPVFWEYTCETCRFYQEPNGERENPQCEVVGQEGDFLGGENIHPRGWCAMWLPLEGAGWFQWAENRLEGKAYDE